MDSELEFYAKVGTQPNRIRVNSETAEKITRGEYSIGDKIQFQVPDRFGSHICNGIITKTEPQLFIDLM